MKKIRSATICLLATAVVLASGIECNNSMLSSYGVVLGANVIPTEKSQHIETNENVASASVRDEAETQYVLSVVEFASLLSRHRGENRNYSTNNVKDLMEALMIAPYMYQADDAFRKYTERVHNTGALHGIYSSISSSKFFSCKNDPAYCDDIRKAIAFYNSAQLQRYVSLIENVGLFIESKHATSYVDRNAKLDMKEIPIARALYELDASFRSMTHSVFNKGVIPEEIYVKIKNGPLDHGLMDKVRNYFKNKS